MGRNAVLYCDVIKCFTLIATIIAFTISESVVKQRRFNKYVILISNQFLAFEKFSSQKHFKSPLAKINAVLVNYIS